MAKVFKMPDLGEGIHEGEVLAVKVAVGDTVKEGDILCEVETDKAAVEIPSPFDGVVQELMITPGDIVTVGQVMVVINGADPKETLPTQAPAAPAILKVGAGTSSSGQDESPVPASPATRRLARELGVDLRRVTPTGPHGLVTAEDVRTMTSGEQPVAPPSDSEPVTRPASAQNPHTGSVDLPRLPDFSVWGPVERVPFRSIRRTTARHMALSWEQIPHVTSQNEVDITELEAFRQKHKQAVASQGGRLTLTGFAIKAVTAALKQFPKFNASLDLAQREIVHKRYYHMGVAVDTNEGLVVPVIRDVDRKNLVELSRELAIVSERIRQGKTALEDIQGGTFTITNTGALGGGQSTPIINYPQVAILGMGAAQYKPVALANDRGSHDIAIRLMMPIVLSFDHRVCDGAEAVRFLKVVMAGLSDPEQLMMMS